MSFWASFMRDIDKEQKITERAKVEEKTREEIRLEDAKFRMSCIEHMSMPGADTIKEYLSLQREIEQLEEEGVYSEWFKKNKEEIEGFFKEMFSDFIEHPNDRYVQAIYYKPEGILKYNIYKLNYKFMVKLLSRYGYIIETERNYDNYVDVKISYERRDF